VKDGDAVGTNVGDTVGTIIGKINEY